MDKPLPVWVYEVQHHRDGVDGRIAYAHLMPPHEQTPVTKRVSDCTGEWAGPMEMPNIRPDIRLPERIKTRLMTLQREIDHIIHGADRLLTTELPDPVQFQFMNSAPRDVLTDYERAQAVSFVTRFDHLPDECRVTAIENDGRYDIENIDYLRHALNEFRPIIQNGSDSVYYQKIHNVCYGMLKLEDSKKGTTIRVFDTTGANVTGICVMWLSEANKAIKYVLKQLDYGYLYNGILQHSDPSYSSRFMKDYTSGELNYIMWKHAHVLDFIKEMLKRYCFLIRPLTSPRPGPL
jgi:hypothetical protein